MSDKKEDDRPYIYVRTFSEEPKTQMAPEMDKEEMQTYVNRLLGAKGLDTAIRAYTSE